MQEEILNLRQDLLELVDREKYYLNTDIKKIILQEQPHLTYEEKLETLISNFKGMAELDAVKAYIEAYISIPDKEVNKEEDQNG